MNESKEYFAILPYLKTSNPVYIRGIPFRSITDLEGIPVESQQHLKTLGSIFFLTFNQRITQMCYAYLPLNQDQEKNRNLFQRLREAQILIGYLYTSPDRFGQPFLTHEHSSMYLFHPTLVSKSLIEPQYDGLENLDATTSNSSLATDLIPGYEGASNWSAYVWAFERSRILPRTPHFWLNLSQDLYHEVQMLDYYRPNWAIESLIRSTRQELQMVEPRIFTALEWYNRSCADHISEDVALVNLAIAFESLLQLEQKENLTARFKETVLTLLGPVPRLDSWLEQFYAVRSRIVHEGRTPHLMFYAANIEQLHKVQRGKEVAVEYRPLTAYGRRIFRLCLNTILSGTMLGEEARLSSSFVHNQERLERICARLSRTDEKPNQRILAVSDDVFDLHEYWMESREIVNLDTLFGAGKLMLRTYLDTSPELPDSVQQVMTEILQQDSAISLDEKIQKFRQLAERLRNWKGDRAIGNVAPSDVFSTMRLFIDYAVMPWVVVKNWREKK